jgi:hypothetical protein
LAYIRLAGLGLKAQRDYDPSWWCTNRRARECRVFTIGRALLEKLNYPPDELLRMVRNATIQVAMRWG